MNYASWSSRVVLAVVAFGVVVVGPSRASEQGQLAVEQVSEASYYDFMNTYLHTHVGDSRGPSGADLIPCRNNIQSLMQSYGLSVTLEPFTYSGTTYYNVVGTLVGSVYPEREYIIGGHYDSVSNPGADDNASGIALVLESARILSQYDSQCTIRFVGFCMEEVGLVGSEAYVAAHSADDIRGMISADMVAYDPSTNDCNIYGRTASNPIKNALAAAVAEYGDGLLYTIGGDEPYSDHAPFEQDGLQACLLIEKNVWSNPYYHTQQDSFEQAGNLNFPYAVKMTRSVVGWLVDAAGVSVDIDYLEFAYPDELPTFSDPAGGTIVTVEVVPSGADLPAPGTGLLHYDIGNGWETAALTELGSNLYEVALPAAPCGTTIPYYFSVQNMVGEVFTGPAGAPATAHTAVAAYGHALFYEEMLDSDPGWTTQADWAFGQPAGSGGASHGGPDPTSGHTGDYVYGYNLNGDYPAGLPQQHLITTPIDCTGRFDVSVSFWRWLGVEQGVYDRVSIGVSNNGSDWTIVWHNTAEYADTTWTQMTLDISDVADNQPTVYIRWTMGPTDGSWQFCGWNIDDIQLTALDCAPPLVLGDLNCDGAVDFGDINPFVLAMLDPAAYATMYADCDALRGDFNGNGALGFEDINPFVERLVGP